MEKRRFALQGQQLVNWLGIAGSLGTLIPLTVLLWENRPRLAIVVVTVTVMPCLFLLLRMVQLLRNAMRLTMTWGELLYGGVRWGWNRSDPDKILGPYCPNPAHGSLLLVRRSGTAPLDGDVIGAGNPLFCPEEPNRDYSFDDRSLSGVAVGTLREQVREALATLGVWRRL